VIEGHQETPLDLALELLCLVTEWFSECLWPAVGPKDWAVGENFTASVQTYTDFGRPCWIWPVSFRWFEDAVAYCREYTQGTITQAGTPRIWDVRGRFVKERQR
jgi:hypothetical protein